MRRIDGKRLLAIAAFPLLIGALFVPVIIWHDAIWKLFTSSERLREWVQGWGAWAPIVFIAIQAVQVIVFVIPGEVPQIAGGYLFGAWEGTILSVTGILLGSAASFFLARALGTPFVSALFPRDQVERFRALLISRGARVIFFLLFLIPGIPKDILCYVAGLTPMRFPFFAAASTLGRLPGIVGSSIIGSAAASHKWLLTGIIAGVAVALFAAGFFLRSRIQGWVERIAGAAGSRPKGPSAASRGDADENRPTGS
jgi:uncharacterized membrane protein YdjX (TVP38/TMEM64 family)